MQRGDSLYLRRGGVMPLTLVSLSLLAGMVALVVDGGTLMEARRHVQAAADAAALAGAANLYGNYLSNRGIDIGGTAQSSALSIASANGFSNDGVQSTVTVGTSPQTYQGGPYVGQAIPAGYIEVSIQYNASHLFSGIFGAGVTPVRARAVARGCCTAVTNNAAIALNLKWMDALQVSGLGGLTVNGGVLVNSNASSALNVTALLGLTASKFTIYSVSSLVGSLLFGLGGTGPTIFSSPPTPDPLRFLAPPDPVQLGLISRGSNLVVSSGTVNLYPGVYYGGIKISGTATVILHANTDGTPGIYYLQGQNGLQMSNSASLTTAAGETAGVTIYNDWAEIDDTIDLSSNGTVALTPPAGGIYQGLGIFQRRGSPSGLAPQVTIGGSGNYNVAGTIYAAYGKVVLTGNSGANVSVGQIIADSLAVNAALAVNISVGTSSAANQRLLGLVE